MPITAFFPAWRPRLAPMGSRTAQAFAQVRAYTLCQLEAALGPWVPATLFPKAARQQNSRDRVYTRWRTFWCLLWQSLNPDASGREVVRQLQALFGLEGGPPISEDDGAYCRAKARLPVSEFAEGLAATAQTADQRVPASTFLQGRPVKVTDGSAVTLAETLENRTAYPPLQDADPRSFPMLRFVVLFSLCSGAISSLAQGSLAVSELALLASLFPQLARGDILVGDRGFGCYPLIALLQHTLGVDFIGRTTRHIDGRRRIKRLARNDWLIGWEKNPKPSPWMSVLQWAGLPAQMTLRVVKGSCYQKGFRVRQVTLVTTLLDSQRYPAEEILQAYLRRWRLEMCLDDLKTTLKMDLLRGRTPEMVQKGTLHAADRAQLDPLPDGAGRHGASRRAGSDQFQRQSGCAPPLRPGDGACPLPEAAARTLGSTAPHAGGRFGAGAARPPRAAGGQTQEAKIPAAECGAG